MLSLDYISQDGLHSGHGPTCYQLITFYRGREFGVWGGLTCLVCLTVGLLAGLARSLGGLTGHTSCTRHART